MSLSGLGGLYLDLLEEMTRVRKEVSELRQEKEKLAKTVEELRDEIRGRDRTRVQGEDREKRGDGVERGGRQDRGEGVFREGNRGAWKVVNKGATKFTLKRQDRNVGIPVGNTFEALGDECEGGEEPVEVGRVDSGGAKDRGILVVGDSQVRYLGKALTTKVRRLECLPGAGIGRVMDRVEDILPGNGAKTVVCLSVGGNDVGRVRSEKLLIQFKEAIEKIRTKGGVSVICSILPRRGASREWMSRAIGINGRLDSYCKELEIPFIDNWHRFYGRDDAYARDGVHLSRKGVSVLGRTIDRVVAGFR